MYQQQSHHQLEPELSSRLSQSLRATKAHIPPSEQHLPHTSILSQHAQQAQNLQLVAVKTHCTRPRANTTASNATMQRSLESLGSPVSTSKMSIPVFISVRSFQSPAIWLSTILRALVAISHRLRLPVIPWQHQLGRPVCKWFRFMIRILV
jgi:hypothetical protein